jgi:hypothetical protein
MFALLFMSLSTRTIAYAYTQRSCRRTPSFDFACSEGPVTSSQIRVACISFCSVATCQVTGAASPFASADLPPLIR